MTTISVPELSILIDSAKDVIEKSHYTQAADCVASFKTKFRFSERAISMHLNISKSEVHRLLSISKLSSQIKDAARSLNIEKYVLVTISERLPSSAYRKELESRIMNGDVVSYAEIKSTIPKKPKREQKVCETCKRPTRNHRDEIKKAG